MSFQMVTSGPGWRLAASLVTLGNEVKATRPNLTCLGTIGNAAHQAEGAASDHNPFVRDPKTGLGVVRAIDIGGPDAELKALRQHMWELYAARDTRLFQFGYAKGCSDNLINNWGLPFAVHVDPGDAGHLHISVTQVNGNSPSAAGYVPAIDSTAPWGLGTAPLGGGTQVGDDVGNVDSLSPAALDQIVTAVLAHRIDPHSVDGPDLAPGAAWPPPITLQRAVVDTLVRVGALETKTSSVDVVALASEILKQLAAK